MWTKTFWKDAAERAVKTFAQFIVTLTAFSGAVGDFTSIDWKFVFVNSAIGAGLSIATSIVTSLSKKSSSASLVK